MTYNQKIDILSVILREDVPVTETDEDKPGANFDPDDQCNLVSLEVLAASPRFTEAPKIELHTTL